MRGAWARVGDRLWRAVVVTVGSGAVVTQRDLRVLSFAVEQFGLPMPLVAELVSRLAADTPSPTTAERVARRLAARLEAGHYIRRVVVAGETWMVPTEAGLALGMAEDQETPYEVWKPAGWKLAHVATVARLRLHLEDRHPGAAWESERQIRRRWHNSGARVRRWDGGLHFPGGQAVGIEVELHIKRASLYEGIVRDQDPTWNAVSWFTPIAQVRLLQQRLQAAGAGGHHEVTAVPEGVAPCPPRLPRHRAGGPPPRRDPPGSP